MSDKPYPQPEAVELTLEEERNHLRTLLAESERQLSYYTGLALQLRKQRDQLMDIGTEVVALPTGQAFDKLQVAITYIREEELTWK